MAGIQIKASKIGSLHSLLGVPTADKIPTGDLASSPTDTIAVRKKKNFAKNAQKWNHSGPSSLKKLMG